MSVARVITHNVGVTEVIAMGGRSLIKYRLKSAGRDRAELVKRHDSIVHRLYRMDADEVAPYLEGEPDVELAS